MQGSWWKAAIRLLKEPTTYECVCTALATAVYASHRSVALIHGGGGARSGREGVSGNDASENVAGMGGGTDGMMTLESGLAVCLPLGMSIGLAMMFFFYGMIGWVLGVFCVGACVYSLAFLFRPLVVKAVGGRGRTWGLLGMEVGLAAVAQGIIVAGLLMAWALTGHWLLNNLLGISLVVWFASLFRFPSMKVASILLVGLFFYDVFWVFFSERFFGKNVMVEVATKETPNPVASIFGKLQLPLNPVEHLTLPVKLVFPTSRGYAMLGLGDIVLPAVTLAYLLHFDIASRRCWRSGLFVKAVLGYGLALLVSFFCNIVYNSPQPALLYIIPAITLPVIGQSLLSGDFGRLWNGPSPKRDADSVTQHLLADDGYENSSSTV